MEVTLPRRQPVLVGGPHSLQRHRRRTAARRRAVEVLDQVVVRLHGLVGHRQVGRRPEGLPPREVRAPLRPVAACERCSRVLPAHLERIFSRGPARHGDCDGRLATDRSGCRDNRVAEALRAVLHEPGRRPFPSCSCRGIPQLVERGRRLQREGRARPADLQHQHGCRGAHKGAHRGGRQIDARLAPADVEREARRLLRRVERQLEASGPDFRRRRLVEGCVEQLAYLILTALGDQPLQSRVGPVGAPCRRRRPQIPQIAAIERHVDPRAAPPYERTDQAVAEREAFVPPIDRCRERQIAGNDRQATGLAHRKCDDDGKGGSASVTVQGAIHDT